MKKLLSLLMFCSTLALSQGVPPKTGEFINDFANVMSPDQKRTLTDLSVAIQKESSTQIVVVVTNDLTADTDLEGYSLGLAQGWGIGQKGVDNGVLILVCPNIRKSRLEIGQGLEGTLTDAYTSELQRNYFRPNFKNGDFYTGILLVMKQIQSKISPEAIEQQRQLATQRKKECDESSAAFVNFMIWFLILGGVATFMTIYVVREVNKKRRLEEERRRVEETEKRRKQKIVDDALGAENNLKEKANNLRKVLEKMGDFYNAKDVLSAKLKDALYQDYAPICDPAVTQMVQISKTLVDNYAIKERVEKNRLNYLSYREQLSVKIAQALSKSDTLYKAYDFSIWPNKTMIDDFLYKMQTFDIQRYESQHNDAMYDAQAGRFNAAFEMSERLVKELEYYDGICNIIFDKETEVKNAISELNSYNSTTRISDKIDEVTRYLRSHASDISHGLKNQWNSFCSDNNHFAVHVKTNNPVKELTRVRTFLDDVKSYLTKAQREVQNAENERRRIREEEAAAERRRLDMIAAAAAATLAAQRRRDDDDRSSSISSSSDSSFSGGGGSFGGGGSSDSW